MAARSDNRRSACPISCALDLVGDKWTLLVVRDMVLRKKRYFREFQDSDEGIASNILMDRLQRLEQAGVVSQRPDPEDARKVIYGLTAKGKDLIPALLELAHWGAKYEPRTKPHTSIAKRLRQDREKLIDELKAELD